MLGLALCICFIPYVMCSCHDQLYRRFKMKRRCKVFKRLHTNKVFSMWFRKGKVLGYQNVIVCICMIYV